MTLTEFAANTTARQHLAKLLNDPVLKGVLEMLQEANLPTFKLQIPGSPPNMDPLHAIALSSTLRAGFQQAIKMLKLLPSMDPNSIAPVQEMLPGWQWTAQPEEGKPKAKRARSAQ